MKIRLIIFLTFFYPCFVYSQSNNSQFEIQKIPFYKFDKSILKQPRYPDNFFEDENFCATKSCLGEFGGQIIFENKETSKIRVFKSTCPIIINQLNRDYYVTSTLTHRRGFASLKQITNLKSSHTSLQTITHLDSIGILILGSFKYNDKLYHLLTDREKTYIASIYRGKVDILNTLFMESIFMYDPVMTETINGYYVLTIQYLTDKSPMMRKKVNGYIIIKDNKITIAKK